MGARAGRATALRAGSWRGRCWTRPDRGFPVLGHDAELEGLQKGLNRQVTRIVGFACELSFATALGSASRLGLRSAPRIGRNCEHHGPRAHLALPVIRCLCSPLLPAEPDGERIGEFLEMCPLPCHIPKRLREGFPP